MITKEPTKKQKRKLINKLVLLTLLLFLIQTNDIVKADDEITATESSTSENTTADNTTSENTTSQNTASENTASVNNTLETSTNEVFSFEKDIVSITIGNTYSQAVKTVSGEPMEFIYTSSDTTIATVDEKGTVTAVYEGTAIITAGLKNSELKASYTVTVSTKSSILFLNGNEVVTTFQVEAGGAIPSDRLPEIPSKKGYTGAWYLGSTPIGSSIENITKDLIIEVKWEPLKYQISFEENGGNALSRKKSVKQVTFDTSYGILPTVTRRGYEFSGWYTTKTGGKPIDSEKQVNITKDTTFYAHWEPALTTTLQAMQKKNYYTSSMTGLTDKKLPTNTIKNLLKPFGIYYGKGMPLSLYKRAMTNSWIDRTDYNNEPKKLTIDITKTLDYDSYVYYLKNLSRYDGVYLYEIGKSTNGRTLYSIEIDMDSEYEKEVFCLTGQTHTREFAGGVFILKQLYELVQKAQTNKDTMEMLKHYKFAAVPIISLDVREGIIDTPSKYTTSNGELWKAYANGTDGNRNYPGLQMGQIYKNYTKKTTIASKPGYANYAGDYAGSCTETQAMMKWFYHYVVEEQALYHIDYHQQGSIIYAGKPWQTAKQLQRCKKLAYNIASVLNQGNRRKYSYVPEDSRYGLRGEGSTATDFTVSLAVGAKFSPAYGFYVFPSNNKEYPLIQVKSLATTKLVIKEANPHFATATLEIGSSTAYLGNSSYTRSLLAKEYKNYHFSSLLEALPKMWEKSAK